MSSLPLRPVDFLCQDMTFSVQCRNIIKTSLLHIRLSEWSTGQAQLLDEIPSAAPWMLQAGFTETGEQRTLKGFLTSGVCCKVCSLPSHSHSQSLSPAIRPGTDFHRPLVSNTIKAEQNVREIMAAEENTLAVLLTLIRRL